MTETPAHNQTMQRQCAFTLVGTAAMEALTAELPATSPTASTVSAIPMSAIGDTIRASTAFAAARGFEAAEVAAAAASRCRMLRDSIDSVAVNKQASDQREQVSTARE